MGTRCPQCLCIPVECSTTCLVCSSEKCCASAHAKHSRLSAVLEFFSNARGMFAAALGIEILCISFAEIGENTGFYIFGLNPAGIAISYAMGYGLAGLSTFLTILGRHSGTDDACGCCSVLEHGGRKGFLPNFKGTMSDFIAGIKKLSGLHRQPDLKSILKSSLVILVTAESACILTAETVDLLLYQYSILLSIPLALAAGAFTVVAPQAYRKSKMG